MRKTVHLLLLQLFRRLPRRGRLFVVHRLYPTFSVGSMCVIERADGAILLVRHSYRRRWGFPGGLLNRGETPVEAAHREAREEVGLAIALVGEPAVVVDPDARRVDVVFRARLAAGVEPDEIVVSSPEIVGWQWFAPDALPELQHEASGALMAVARSSSPLTAANRPVMRRVAGA